MLLPQLAHSDADEQTLTVLLDTISAEIASINTLASSSAARYRFSYHPSFPCSATITETSSQDGVQWLRRYRFELSDISTGTLFSAQDSRRAISYYGQKTTAGGITREYPPKKISAFRMNTGEQPDGNIGLISNLGEVILRCEERNDF